MRCNAAEEKGRTTKGLNTPQKKNTYKRPLRDDFWDEHTALLTLQRNLVKMVFEIFGFYKKFWTWKSPLYFHLGCFTSRATTHYGIFCEDSFTKQCNIKNKTQTSIPHGFFHTMVVQGMFVFLAQPSHQGHVSGPEFLGFVQKHGGYSEYMQVWKLRANPHPLKRLKCISKHHREDVWKLCVWHPCNAT